MLPDPDALADVVVQTIDLALGPVLERLAAAEARLSMLGDVRDRVVTMETKALSAGDLSPVLARLAVLEARPQVPGPTGEPGPPGKDGLDGKDGTAGLSFEGVYQDGKSYELGHLVTWGGSSWHANEHTTSKPGTDGTWTLMVKRGRDGRDGQDAPGLPVVSVGRR